VFNRGQIRVFGKSMLIIRQEPDFIQIRDKLKSLVDNDLVAKVGRIKGAAKKRDMHRVIVADVYSQLRTVARQ